MGDVALIGSGWTKTWYGFRGRRSIHCVHTMQVPADLASQLSTIAVSSGRSPEAFLREAISRLIESSAHTLATLEAAPQHPGFVPQPQGFSVYE